LAVSAVAMRAGDAAPGTGVSVPDTMVAGAGEQAPNRRNPKAAIEKRFVMTGVLQTSSMTENASLEGGLRKTARLSRKRKTRTTFLSPASVS
jgi:hypothetical protein